MTMMMMMLMEMRTTMTMTQTTSSLSWLPTSLMLALLACQRPAVALWNPRVQHSPQACIPSPRASGKDRSGTASSHPRAR